MFVVPSVCGALVLTSVCASLPGTSRLLSLVAIPLLANLGEALLLIEARSSKDDAFNEGKLGNFGRRMLESAKESLMAFSRELT